MTGSNIATAAATVIVVAIVAAVAALTWHGSITGEAAVALYASVLGGSLVGGAVHVGVKQGARARGGVE